MAVEYLTQTDTLATDSAGRVVMSPLSSEIAIQASSGSSGIYSNAKGDFTVTLDGGDKVVKVSDLPYPITWRNVVMVRVKNSLGDITQVPTTNIAVTESSGVYSITLADKQENFAVTDEADVYLIFEEKAINQDLDAVEIVNQNPEWSRYTEPESLVSETNLDTETKRYVIPFEGYKYLTLHTDLTTADAGDTLTMTIWGTLNEDADDTADTDWVDMSTSVFGAASVVVSGASGDEKSLYLVDAPSAILKWMIKIVDANGGTAANTADILVKKSG